MVLCKQPKLHFLDPGVRRAVINQRGDANGHEFESAVVAEVVKQCRTARLPVELSHLRTTDGREIDLLIERDDGFIAIEYRAVVYLDFERDPRLGELFSGQLDPTDIMDRLQIYRGVEIIPRAGDTLVIFDEIQDCPEALNSLKYFCEEC